MPPPPGEAGADPGMPGVEQGREPGLRDDLVQRVDGAVVREERLHVWVELEAAHAVVADEPPRRLHCPRAHAGID